MLRRLAYVCYRSKSIFTIFLIPEIHQSAFLSRCAGGGLPGHLSNFCLSLSIDELANLFGKGILLLPVHFYFEAFM